MDGRITGLTRSEARYIQLRLSRAGRSLVDTDIAGTIDLHATAAAVLAADPDNEELALIARDRDELGYLTVGHLAAILSWMITHEPDPFPAASLPVRCAACHRLLNDDVSRRHGYGPVCWERRLRATG